MNALNGYNERYVLFTKHFCSCLIVQDPETLENLWEIKFNSVSWHVQLVGCLSHSSDEFVIYKLS